MSRHSLRSGSWSGGSLGSGATAQVPREPRRGALVRVRGGASCASVCGHPRRYSCTAAAGRRSCCAAPAAPAAPAAARPS
eukprot:scaffold131929_cov57-Phaeocystis_antarctica.AAC.2